MQRFVCVCLVLGLAGCGKEREEKTQVARRTPPPTKTAAEPPPPYDPEEKPPTKKPRPSLSALQKEVDAFLAEPPIIITATDLVKAYQDQAAADKRFAERKVWVTGYVLRTGRGTLGAPYVELDPGKAEGGAVRCFFNKGHSLTVEELKENQEVTVEGRVAAKTGNEVRVADCRILTPAFVQSVLAAAQNKKTNR